MSTKDDVQKIFAGYFDGLKAIYEYFGVENFDTYNYELQRSKDTWRVAGRRINDTLHWAIPTDIEEPEGTFQEPVHGIFRKEFHTLIFVPSSTGDAGFAMIFDNDKEVKDE